MYLMVKIKVANNKALYVFFYYKSEQRKKMNKYKKKLLQPILWVKKTDRRKFML